MEAHLITLGLAALGIAINGVVAYYGARIAIESRVTRVETLLENGIKARVAALELKAHTPEACPLITRLGSSAMEAILSEHRTEPAR